MASKRALRWRARCVRILRLVLPSGGALFGPDLLSPRSRLCRQAGLHLGNWLVSLTTCVAQKAKKDRAANEEVFSFLVDPKDVGLSFRCALWDPSH